MIAVFVSASLAGAEGLKKTNMGNQSLGSGGGAMLTQEQLSQLGSLTRSPKSSGDSSNQPQISPEQMAKMMKALEEYKATFQERNKALQNLLEEDH